MEATLLADVNETVEEAVDTPDLPTNDSPSRPEFLPENYWDAEKGDVKLEDLVNDLNNRDKRANDLRKIISRGLPEAPDDVSGYAIESEELSAYLQDDDPALTSLKNTLHKHGLPNIVYNDIVGDVLTSMKEAGLIDEPLSKEEQEARKIEQEDQWRKQETAKLGANADKIIAQVGQWGKQLQDSGVFGQDELEAYYALGSSANGIKLLNKLRQEFGAGKPIPMEGVQTQGLKSKEEWQAQFGPNMSEQEFARAVEEAQRMQKAGLL